MKTQYYRKMFYVHISTAIFLILAFLCAVYISLILYDRSIILNEHEQRILNGHKEAMKDRVDAVISEIEHDRASVWGIYADEVSLIMQSLRTVAAEARNEQEFYALLKSMSEDSKGLSIYTYVRPAGILRTIFSGGEYIESDVPEETFRYKVKRNKIKEALWASRFNVELGIYYEDKIIDNLVKESFTETLQRNIIEGQKYLWVNQIVPYAKSDFTYKVVRPFFEEAAAGNAANESIPNTFELEGIERNGDVYFYFQLNAEDYKKINPGEYLAYSKAYPAFSWIIGTAVSEGDIRQAFSEDAENIDKQFVPQIILNLLLLLTVIIAFMIFIFIVEHRYFRIIKDYAVKLENTKRVYETRIGELKKDSDRDAVTNLYNRRFMLSKLTRQFEISKQSAKNYSLIMSDIDFFKSINDTYGHDAGDYVLREISTTMQNVLRADDYLARYGGEEFLILLTSEGVLNNEILFAIAEKLRRCVEERKIVYNGKEIRVTMSFGVSSFYITDETFNDAVRRVDAAMYESKQTGRNRVTIKDD